MHGGALCDLTLGPEIKLAALSGAYYLASYVPFFAGPANSVRVSESAGGTE